MIEKDEPLTISQYTLKEMIRQTIFSIAVKDVYKRQGLRQLNSGKIYRKVGRADCGNDFSNTL